MNKKSIFVIWTSIDRHFKSFDDDFELFFDLIINKSKNNQNLSKKFKKKSIIFGKINKKSKLINIVQI